MNGNNFPDNELPVAERIAYLVAGFLRGTLTEAEHNELDAWVVASDENTRLFERLTDESAIETGLRWKEQINEEAALAGIKERIRPLKKNRRLFLPIGIAAFLILAALTFFFITHYEQNVPPVAGRPDGVRPGKDQAVLTLAGGRAIILDSAGSGVLAQEGGITVAQAGGALQYQGSGDATLYHNLSVPRGGQYRLTLADGTNVWLNAESSLRFPASFANDERNVEVQGEAYFEVAKDASRPFRVAVRTRLGTPESVEVLGTHFNVNGYGDDGAIRTTLLEGSVRVRHGPQFVVLKPGEAARSSEGGGLEVEEGDPAATAWKEGLFRFRGATIQTIAAQLSRWYDIEVEIRGVIPDHFTATIDRKEPLQDLLRVLEETHRVRFTLRGKELIISP